MYAISEFLNFWFIYSKLEFKLGCFSLLRIDMLTFKIRSSKVSSGITDSIEFVQVSIEDIEVIVIREILATLSFVVIN